MRFFRKALYQMICTRDQQFYSFFLRNNARCKQEVTGNSAEVFVGEATSRIREINLQWSRDRKRNILGQDTSLSDPETQWYLGVASLPLEHLQIFLLKGNGDLSAHRQHWPDIIHWLKVKWLSVVGERKLIKQPWHICQPVLRRQYSQTHGNKRVEVELSSSTCGHTPTRRRGRIHCKDRKRRSQKWSISES